MRVAAPVRHVVLWWRPWDLWLWVLGRWWWEGEEEGGVAVEGGGGGG
jgi:hypothetical protein